MQEVLGLGEVGYGVILGLNGVGALIGSLALFILSKHIRKGFLLIFALLMFNSAVSLFAIAPNILISGLAMVLLGLAFSAWMISVPVLLQTASSEKMRGRVMSLYFMVVLTHQLGWVVGGIGIEAWGIQTTMFIGVVGGLIVAGSAIIMTPELRNAR